MRFTKLWIDGYGRFTARALELAPRLQIVLGPNEQGKTTIRSFIADMLYGQRRNAHANEFDANHSLRRPWQDPKRYSGRITYVLDDACEIEVHRTFDAESVTGSVHVFDRTHGEEITSSFSHGNEREPHFAERHLGLSKAVFVNTATLGHLTLDHLGDNDALSEIRERILGLADSSEESGSADSALRRLTERIALIGRPAVDVDRPLPTARARRAQFEAERAAALAARETLANLEREQNTLRTELSALQKRRAACDTELRAFESRDRLQRFIEAQRVQLRIDEVTQKCFALSSVREFPIDQTPEVQRAANAVATARAQVDRTKEEQKELGTQLDQELDRLGPGANASVVDIPDQSERELTELETRITRLAERFEALEEEREKAEQRVAQAQRDLENIPDFSQIETDPVEWLSQLAMSFRLAAQSCANETEKQRRLKESIDKKQSELVKPGWVFSKFDDFLAEAREYDVHGRLYREQSAALQTKLENARTLGRKKDSSVPALLWGAGILTLFGAGFFAAAYFLHNAWLYIPGGLCIALFLTLVGGWIYGRLTARNAHMETLEIQDELLRIEEESEELREKIDRAMAEAGVESLRDLEALYEQHSQGSSELKALREAYTEQEAIATEEQERVNELLAKIKDTFANFRETVSSPDDVSNAANRAIARYQEYRDAKRRLVESRDRPGQLAAQCERVKKELEEIRRDEVSRALVVREEMRDAGFREESRFTSALGAVRAFRVRNADLRQKRGRIEVLRERAVSLTARLDAEEKDLTKCEDALTRKLAVGGAQSIEQWHELTRRAKQYRDAWDERSRSMEKMDTLLRGETLETLRKSVERDTAVIETFRRTPAAVKEELERLHKQIEECTAREHSVQLQIVKQDSGQRSINEIEEDLALENARVARFEFELKAASYAASVIEEVARDKHARIAPRMASLAGKYLDEITEGAYKELILGRDLNISVRIPQTNQVSDNPRSGLSKGTIDQIYLAMRLALVRSLSDTGESIPLLLDDPFANYDDARLANALRLLERVSESNQVLLFTCRQDVAKVAEVRGVPILRL